MKKIILAFAVLLITSIGMNGQPQGGKQSRKTPEERTERIITKMKTDLALSDDQVLKLKPVILKREQQRDEAYGKMNETKMDTKKARMDAEDEFQKILTPEQYEKLKQERKEMREKHHDKQGM